MPTFKSFPRFAAAAIAAALLVATTGPVQAQSEPVVSLEQTLEKVREARRAVAAENREREQRFRRERDRQQAELQRIRQEVEAAEAEAARLEGVRNENERAIGELNDQLAERQGEFAELFGAARAAAGDLNEKLGESLVSAELPGRGEPLVEIAQSRSLPTVEQLETLWFTLHEEAAEQARVARFDARVIDTANQPVERTVTRIGPFTAFADGQFLRFDGEMLNHLARQPGGRANQAARRVENHTGDGYVAGVIDPSLGTLLGLVVETPTLRERIDQGGGIGYAIIVIAAFGVLLAIYKWIMLTLTARRVRAQLTSKKASSDNPLGRVMLVYEENRDADIESLQLKLQDAVLKELPRLEGGLNIVKVLAAVTPLMGLLGTVIGMIVTFQAITLFGTGDPKLMAGGISQALVTTVLGLVSAIPLLLLHTFASGASRSITQTLEEQSAGLIAEYAGR